MVWLSVSEENHPVPPKLTVDQERKRRNRSIAIAVVLGALVVIMIAITLVQGPETLIRPV